MTSFDLQEKLDTLSLQRCFHQSPSHESVSVVSTYLQNGDPDACRNEHQYVTEPQDVRRLPGTKSNVASTGYVARIICLSQNNSFKRINATRATIETILGEHDITDAFLDIASCFYNKSLNVEEALSVPFQCLRSHDRVEYMYTLRFPEETLRDHDEPWSLRQMALYHQIRTSDQRSTFVLITAYPNSVAKDRLIKWLTDMISKSQIQDRCLEVNRVLLEYHTKDWRAYMRHYESEIERLSIRMLTIGLKHLDGVVAKDIADLSFTERRLIPVDAILAATTRLAQDIGNFIQSNTTSTAGPTGGVELVEFCANLASTTICYRENAATLLVKCTSTLGVLNSILNLNNQRIAQQQNDRVFYLTTATVDDSATVRVITAITLVFLSFTAVAAVMAMPLFYLKDSDRTLALSPSFWIYIATSVPLTVVILAYWRLMLYLKRRRRNNVLGLP